MESAYIYSILEDIWRLQSVYLFCACKSRVSEGYGDLMLFRLILLPLPPGEPSLQQSSILFPASLHPYRTNDHGSGQLLNAVVSSVLLSDSGSTALDAIQMYLLHSNTPNPLPDRDRLMWFWITSVKCATSHSLGMITDRVLITFQGSEQSMFKVQVGLMLICS